MDAQTRANRTAWDAASQKYVREYDDLLAQAASGSSLFPEERRLLAEILHNSPCVVHLQSGNGLDDVALVGAGAQWVVGVDYSEVAVASAQRRARELGTPCWYVVGALPGAPLADACVDLAYTGKGGLNWIVDLAAWAQDVSRLLRPAGHLFIYEAHPAVALWTWDEDEPRIRRDRSYFDPSHVNDTFPGRGAVEMQWNLGQVVSSLAVAGMEVLYLSEYAEPFWRPRGVTAAAWNGRLPNAFALLARRRG